MLKILITGSSGFIGTNLIEFLKERNYNYDCISLRDGIPNINYDKYNVIVHLSGIAHDTSLTYQEKDYLSVNYRLTLELFKVFLNSKSVKFISLSSIKAVCDESDFLITEKTIENPTSIYGKTKLMTDEYIMNFIKKQNNQLKQIYILRPCLIYGINSKGNLNLLNKYINLNLPWFLAAFENKKSLCNIKNLFFVIENLISNNINSGIYNISDNHVYSTNQIIKSLAITNNKIIFFIKIPKNIILLSVKFLDLFNNKNKFKKILNKITHTLVVDNSKIKTAISKELPYNFNTERIIN